MITIPPYKRFKKSDIKLGYNDKPIIDCFYSDNGFISSEKEKDIIYISAAFGFEFDQLTNEFKVVRFNEDIRTWNVVKTKKFRQLTIAIYDLLEVDYVEL